MELRRMFALALAGMLALFALPACAGGPPATRGLPSAVSTPGQEGSPPTAPLVVIQPVDELNPAVQQALSAFSLDLFRRVEAQDEGKNVFLSPLSVWLALGMTANGAAGDTAEGIRQALHAADIKPDDLNRDNAGLMGLLIAADPGVRTAIANSIWMRNTFTPDVNRTFLDTNRKLYGTEVQSLDFSSGKAADAINQWVSANTGGKIQNMVQPPIPEDAVMYLINAVYFKAPWQLAFDPKKTYDGTFAAGDTKAPVKYLSQHKDNNGYADKQFSIARIPYASGRLEFVAILPRQQTLGAFVKNLTPEKLQQLIGRCQNTSMALSLPKFQVEYEVELKDALSDMGMDQAFIPLKADFTALSEKRGKELFISKVKHKSFIQVNEEGTEAAAVTSVEIQAASADRWTLEFNQPFLYLIRDSKTGAVLFLGAMENPAQ